MGIKTETSRSATGSLAIRASLSTPGIIPRKFTMACMQQILFIICILSGPADVGTDWTSEMCNSGMCFNGETECRNSCDRHCSQQRTRGFCYFDNFLSRVFICWCSFDQSETSTTTAAITTTTTATTSSSTKAPTTGSSLLSVLTLTEAEDCGATRCYVDRQTCDRACADHCRPDLFSCGMRWHGRYKCQCIQEVVVQQLSG